MSRKYVSIDTVRSLVFHPSAVRTGLTSARVDFSNGCENPVSIELVGLPDRVVDGARRARKVRSARTELVGDDTHIWFQQFPAEYSPARPQSVLRFWVDLNVACRKCQHCLKRRSALWAHRAYQEVKISSRTWFLTFTLSPTNRVRAKILASRRYGNEDFSSIAKVVSNWFTLYMKRVRKNSGLKLRYLMAIEEHKDGFPHLHALVHEMGVPLSKRVLQAEWPYGFTNCKLCSPDTARYVTKYLAKSQMARVRASLNYGQVTNVSPCGIVSLEGTEDDTCIFDPPNDKNIF